MLVEEEVIMENLNVNAVRDDFPILHQKIEGKPLVYFDNAATTQKPQAVINAVNHFYREENANIHRGIHTLSERATASYEQARKALAKFINAKHSEEIIFVRGTTEAINLVADSFGFAHFKQDDEIILSTMEHHSNIVPWQLIAEKTGAKIKVIPISHKGEIELDD